VAEFLQSVVPFWDEWEGDALYMLIPFVGRFLEWVADHQPLETMRRANTAVAVHVEPDGRVYHRRLTSAELQVRTAELATLPAGGLNPDNLSAWLKSCAVP
jgi:hypothetical protein